MKNAAYIALDTETGGIGPEVSLLTVYFLALDENFTFVDQLSLAIKPDNGIYHTTAEALSINKINLIEHDKQAISPGKAGGLLRDFLIKHSNSGTTKLIPVGHNVAFDLEKVYSNLLNKNEAQKYVSYRTLDTGVIANALKVVGKMPAKVSGSLTSLVEYFNIPMLTAHTAMDDTLMTVEVLKKELDAIR